MRDHRRVKVDYTIPLTDSLDARDAVRQAERDGYDGVWTSEIRHDPFLALAVAATATERVDLGTAIALAFARNPMSVAVLGNDLQQLSRGRLLLGLGSQIRPHITKRFSMPWSEPARRMREYIQAVRGIWDAWRDGTRLGFRGEFYTHTLMTPMFTPEPHGYGAPPILLAGVGPAMTKVAGEVADGFLCHGFTTERYLREVTLPALRAGRPGGDLAGFTVVGAPMVLVGRTEQELATAAVGARAQIAFYASTPAYRGVLELHGYGALVEELHALSLRGEWARMGTMIEEDLLNAVCVVGTPEDVAAGIQARYGDIFTRAALYAPYDVAPELAAALARAVRA
jgi:probable F420-dependent oxidoreductase